MKGMTEEQKELFDKLTPLQQKVCTHTLEGMQPADAHKAAGGKCKQESNRRTLAGEILANPCAKEFLDSMKHTAVNDAIMSREEMMKALSDLSRINVSDLLTSDIGVLTEFKGGYDLKLKASLSAMAQLSKIAGYDAPQQVESTVTQVNYSSEEYKLAIESLDSELKARR